MFNFISNIVSNIINFFTGRDERQETSVASSADGPGKPSGLRVTIIDVGKGDCILVQTPTTAILIDTGYKSTADQVIETLKSEGVERLDAMIITHYDRDHIEGIRRIGRGVPVDIIYLPGYEGGDRNYRMCMRSVRALGVKSDSVTGELDLPLGLGDAQLTVLPSGVEYKPKMGKVEGNDNDMSLVEMLTYGRDSYLFAADLKAEGIAAYLTGAHGHFDVLKMPHHGRISTGTSAFLDDVSPKIAVITDSDEASADTKTLELLKSAGVRSLRTSDEGTVAVESDGTGTYSVSQV